MMAAPSKVRFKGNISRGPYHLPEGRGTRGDEGTGLAMFISLPGEANERATGEVTTDVFHLARLRLGFLTLDSPGLG